MLLSLDCKGPDVKRVAHKLHQQFGHPTTSKLINLIRDAGVKHPGLENAINNVSKICAVCCRFKRPTPHPVVSAPMASKYNEAIAMDLKVWGSHYFLVIID